MWKAILIVILGGLSAFCGSSVGGEARGNKELTLDLGHNVSLKLVLIPAGKFLMGSPEKERLRARDQFRQREVTITKDFYLGCCEVTRRQFAAFVRDAGYRTQAEKEGWAFAWDGKKWDKIKGASWKNVGFDQRDDHPVICVSWNDAVAFCNWLSSKTGKAVRLPTEAEWEYCCRAGTETAYCWGDDPDQGKGWCNAADKTGKREFRSWRTFAWEDGYVLTAPVGTFRANGFGLHDMHGNVSEWCSDWYDKSYANAKNVDPKGPDSGTLRVLRGGSWLSSPGRCRCAFRSGSTPLGSYCDFIVGFRVVVEITP